MRGVLGAGVLDALGRRGKRVAALLAVLGALALPATAQADVLVSNLGQTFVGSSELRNGDPVGQTFSIATSNDNYTLSSIEITFRRNGIASTDMGSLTVAIWSTHASGTNAGHPKSPLYMLTNPASVANPASLEAETPATFGAPANATLRAGRTYAVVVVYSKTIANLADAPFWTRTDADDDADPAPGWSIVNARHASAAGSSTWDEDSGEAHKIRVNGTVVPGEVLVSNFGQTLSSLTSALRNGDRLGQTFSIAPTSNDNYTLSSIEIPFQTNGIASTDMGLLTVAIWSTHASGTNAGHPDSPLYTLTNPASITADTTVTFDAPVNSTLRAGRTYAVVVVYSKNIDTADIADAAQWPTVGTGDDADAAPGWSIVDALHASAAGASSWSETSGQARMIRVNGTAIQADALVSNLGQTSSLTSALRNGDRLGQTFSIATGSGNYAPSSIEIPFQTNGIASTDMGLLTVAIWSTHASGTNAGHPDSPLYTLTNPASITADTTATFNAPADSTLAAGRTYAVVVVYSKNIDTADIADAAQWPTVGTGDDADAAPGWSIVDALHASAAGASSWSETSGQARMIRVNGNAAINNAPEFSVDLPSFTLPENSAADTVVGTVTATDADSDTLTYSLEGTDAASFDIVSGTGEIKTVSTATYNYESKKTYSVTVRADDGTDSATVDVAIALTDELEKSAKPAAPTVTAKPATTDSLNVRWTEPGLNGGPDITGYEVEYREGVGNWTDAYDGSALSTIISGLSADTEYEVQVRANNGETPSDWSDSTEATTNAEVITPTCTLTAGDLWCGVVTVDAILFEGTPLGYGFRGTIGDLSDDDGDKMFTFGANSYTIDAVHVATGSSAGILTFSLTSALSDTDKEKAVLHIGSDSFAFDDAGAPGANYHYRWTSSLDWSSETFVTLRLQVPSTLLSGITVNGISIPGFLADDDAPQYGVSATTTTAAIVATAASASASVSYSGTDADTSTADVHDVMLSDGANTVIITVTDGSVPATTYTLGVNRAVTAKYGWKADSDFDTLKLAGNNDPRGIWYDATTATFYVCDFGDDKVYVYDADGTYDSDFNVSANPNGIWSDGATLWVADSGADKLFAYTLSSGAADSGKDFDTLNAADNDDPRGVFSDGTTMWVSDGDDKKVYAYKRSDKSRDSGKDFDTLDAAGNDSPRGLWSDGTTMWVSDSTDKKIYAYKLSDKSHDAGKDFDTLDAAGNATPRGLWSDGSVLWTTDDDNDKLFAYNLVEASTPPCTLDPDDDDLWCGVVTVGADVVSGLTVAYGFDEGAGSLSDDDGDKTFTFGTNTYTIDRVAVGTAALSQTQAGTLTFSLTSALSTADKGKLVLYVGSNSFAFDAAVGPSATTYTYHWSMTVLDWSMETSVTLRLRENNDPVFADASVAREVEENSPVGTNVGAVIPEATDADSGDTLTYSMEGTDAASFDFDASTRQITTITGEDYNHEATQNSYEVTVKADDSNGGTATIDVTINVTDVNEQSAKPDKPTLAAVMGSSTTLTATWTKPDLNGGPAITGYRVEYRQGSQNWQNFPHSGTAVTTTITGLTANTSYQVQVRAKNGETDSDWSDASDAVSTNAEIITPPPPDPADASDGTVRLVDRRTEAALTPDGMTEVTGIVEIAYNNEWRSVCDDSWTYRGARVVCRELGYTVEERETVAALIELPFGPDADENRWYWLDDVNCEGNEATLLECPHAEIGTHNCGARERAGVTCGKGKTADTRLRTLELSGIDLPFDPDTDTYELTVLHAVDQITVTYTTAANAEVAFDPVDDADTGTDGHQVNLAVGPNTLRLTVTATDNTTQTYTLTITRAGADGIPPSGPSGPPGAGPPGGSPPAEERPAPVGYLENPGDDSFQSGIGVISGWVCAADKVEIEIETERGETERYEAGYGTARLDTAALPDGTPLCGDTDNGFGLLFNWNRLGAGEHTVVAWVDGVELGRAVVTVTTVGAGAEEEFLRDVAGTCEVEDFPLPGEMVRLEWQQNKQNFVITSGTRPAGANRAGVAGMGYLENPGPNSFQSGIGVISGWVCEAEKVEIEIETERGETERQVAAYGTERLDTALQRKDGTPLCGDTDNGFGLLFNWNRLGAGEHTVVAYVDDVELGRAVVRVTTVGEGAEAEFLRGAEGECVVADFPTLGETVTLAWQQNSQNFVITDAE